MATSQHSAQPTQFTMAGHPDIVALREKYERQGSSGTAGAVEGLAFLAGLYAAISPWVIGFNGQTTLAANNLIVGVAAALLALGYASAYERTHAITWVSPILGIWLIISPWIVSGVTTSTGMLWSNIVVGACVLVFGLAGAGMAFTRPSETHRRDATPVN